MQIDVHDYLRLIEDTNKLAFFDIESTGFKGDYNSVLVVSVKPYHSKPTTFKVLQPGNDQRVVREAKEFLEQFDCYCGFYSKGFDIPMLNTRLLKWNQKPIEARHHLDLYFSLKYKMNTSSKSLAAMSGFLKLPSSKMNVTSEVWSEIAFNYDKHMPTLVKRCESDVVLTQSLYDRTKHLVRDLKRG